MKKNKKTLKEILVNACENQIIPWGYLEEVKGLKLYQSGNAFTNEGTYYEVYTTGQMNEEEENYAPKEEKNRMLIQISYPTSLTKGSIFINHIS